MTGDLLRKVSGVMTAGAVGASPAVGAPIEIVPVPQADPKSNGFCEVDEAAVDVQFNARSGVM